MPTGKVVGQITVVHVAPDNMGVVMIKQSEGAPDAADIDGLPQPVEDQHVPVEQRLHGMGGSCASRTLAN